MIYAYASESHYRDHLTPITDLFVSKGTGKGRLIQYVDTPVGLPAGSWVLVAGRRDARKAKQHRTILIEHGAGQHYGIDAGGPETPHTNVELFIAPNQTVADRGKTLFPNAERVSIGSPHVEHLHGWRDSWIGERVPVIAFHWDSTVAPEARSAFGHYQGILPRLADAFPDMIGHCHPRQTNLIKPVYEKAGIVFDGDWVRLARRTSVLIVDNSSIMWEAAALDIPIVVLNAPHYRRDVNHGLRFWDHADVGSQVNDPDQLAEAITWTLQNPGTSKKARAAAAATVYAQPYPGATLRAIAAIQHVASG